VDQNLPSSKPTGMRTKLAASPIFFQLTIHWEKGISSKRGYAVYNQQWNVVQFSSLFIPFSLSICTIAIESRSSNRAHNPMFPFHFEKKKSKIIINI
jgi:hypothetical protein